MRTRREGQLVAEQCRTKHIARKECRSQNLIKLVPSFHTKRQEKERLHRRMFSIHFLEKMCGQKDKSRLSLERLKKQKMQKTERKHDNARLMTADHQIPDKNIISEMQMALSRRSKNKSPKP
jgi:hypothetical protein